MSKVVLHNLQKLDRLTSETYLVILYACSVPPHLGIVSRQKYYSLSVKGRAVSEPVNVLMKLIKQKNIASLFIQLNNTSSASKNLYKAFTESPNLSDQVSCLNPIRTFLTKSYSIDFSSCHFVFSIVPELIRHNLIDAAFYLNLEEHMNNNSFELLQYTMNDVQNRISSYSQLQC